MTFPFHGLYLPLSWTWQYFVLGWWRSIVVRMLVLAGGLSLSCARLMDGCLTTLWVQHPLSVNQHSQLSLPSPGSVKWVVTHYMGYGRWGPLYSWLGLPGQPLCQPVSAGCTQWLCDWRLWLVSKSALEVCIRDDALHKLQPLPFAGLAVIDTLHYCNKYVYRRRFP